MTGTCTVCGLVGWVVDGLCQSCRWFALLTDRDVDEICERIGREGRSYEFDPGAGVA